jgi:HPt (histidine-containing phosphotransfer) domain-containing protein
VDIEAIAKEHEMDVDDVEMLLEVFKSSVNDSLGKLKTAIGAGDNEGVRFALHKIAGSSASIFGLSHINQIAREGENNIRAGKSIDAPSILNTIETALKQAGII